jgi:pimeloyl-ACP methyl ester carboxylesterase
VRRHLSNTRIAVVLVMAVFLLTFAARADVVILKDGYTLHGVRTLKEKASIVDPLSGEAFVVDKVSGVTAIDDGPRWTVFPVSYKQVVDVGSENIFKDHVNYTPKKDRYLGTQPFPKNFLPPEVKPWDRKEWTREVVFLDGEAINVKHTLKQYIAVISPYYLRIGSSTHAFTQYYLTKEFNPNLLREFLMNHPDLGDVEGKAQGDRREKLFRFWVQADWLEPAEKELELLKKDVPNDKDRYAKLRSELNGLKAEAIFAEVERARESGRHRWAMNALNSFPKEDVPNTIAVKVTTLRAEYETRQAKYQAAKRYLTELSSKLKGEPTKFLVDASQAVNKEVHLDTMPRIEIFSTLAERAELDAKGGRKPHHSPEELLAAAVTGWHLGKVSAETKAETARKCWVARQMALEYLRTTNRVNRRQLLDNYLKGSDALPYDEIEKLVSLLPPPDAPSEITNMTIKGKLEVTVDNPHEVEYIVRLPDEYQAGRPYPLVILLPDGFEKPEEILQKMGDYTSRYGYIAIAMKWYDPLKNKYGFTQQEHTAFMNLMRFARRTFQVDSDRIFLLGRNEGGTMAVDIAAGHPDLFAGVIPFNPRMITSIFITCGYWFNFFQLPLYVVMGDRAGNSVSAIRASSERWMPRGFPTLIVSYKGRGAEWFPEELPHLFDWMGRKKRAEPGRVLGPAGTASATAEGYRTVRESDNRFFWISTDQLSPSCILDPEGKRIPAPATIQSKITEGNFITVKGLGLRQATVWFGKGMVDYDKPVKIKMGERAVVTKTIKPQISVMMEDLYERGDRQRPFFERLDFKLP